MTTRYGPTSQERRFADFLIKLAKDKDRAALAALRRGLRSPDYVDAEMHRYVVPWLSAADKGWREDIFYLVAALFASHRIPCPTDGDDSQRRTLTNLGASFAQLAPENSDARPGVDRRFTALLNSHQDDLPDRLRHAVSLLKSAEVPVDWARLLYDLRRWDWRGRRVQREWARAFWGGQSSPSGNGASNQEDQDVKDDSTLHEEGE